MTQVNKIEVQYDKTSKQVDVQALKCTLWANIQESIQLPAQVLRDLIKKKKKPLYSLFKR